MAKLHKTRAIVAGSFDQDGYIQIYDRANGEVVHEMHTLDGSAVTELEVTRSKIVALLSIRHKLLTCKLMVLNANNGDLIAEQTFVDVLKMNIVFGRQEINSLGRVIKQFVRSQGPCPPEQPNGRLPESCKNTYSIFGSIRMNDFAGREFPSTT